MFVPLKRGSVRLATIVLCAVAMLGSSAAAQTLPSTWSTADIGAPKVKGSANYDEGSYMVSGAGLDIWGTSDQFRFVYQAVTGDVDVVTRVASLQKIQSWTKGGLMVRQSLSANAANAFVFVSAGKGVAFQKRPSAGALSSYTSGGSGKAPAWLKLQRRGNTLTAFRSSNGTSWTQIGQQTLALSSSFYIGIAVTSHDVTKRASGTFDQVAVTKAPPSTVPPPPGNQPPSVSLTSPAGGTKYATGSNVTLAATASDSDGSVARVDFYQGGALLGSDSSSPYSYTWQKVPAGTYSLTAVARDNKGATTTSAASMITVGTTTSGNKPPSVSITSPANGATYQTPATVPLSATASDSDGTVTKVDFYVGSLLIGSDTKSPYAASWVNVIPGAYSIVAVARDNAGATTSSSPHDIVVADPSMPHRAIFTPSKNHATAVDRYVLDIYKPNAKPGVSNPLATVDLGKPPIIGGVCEGDILTAVLALAPGNYIATITAFGPGGSARSGISSFSR